MNSQKQLLSRLIFLLIFGAIIFGIFFLGHNLSKSQAVQNAETDKQEFIPSEKGQAVLIEFADFQCPACRFYYPLVKQLSIDFGDKLRIGYKYFPLQMIHMNAQLSARAGEAAKLQGKFSEMEELMFTKQEEWQNSNKALSILTAYASSIGLDKDRFLADIDSDQVRNKVEADYLEGQNLGVAGTPTFFLNGKKISNPRNYDEFKKLIEEAIGK